jgi:hypothetical protein
MAVPPGFHVFENWIGELATMVSFDRVHVSVGWCYAADMPYRASCGI